VHEREPEGGPAWFDDSDPEVDSPGIQEASRSYHLFFVCPEGEAFNYETEIVSIAERDWDGNEDESELPMETVAGSGRTGWSVAVSLIAPFAVVTLSDMETYEDGSSSGPTLESHAFSETGQRLLRRLVKSARNGSARTKSKAARDMKKRTVLLDHIQPNEAAIVLQRLLAVHPELLAEAEEISRMVLGDVSFESIAGDVEDSIRQLDLDDLNGRAGRHSWGYTEPSEAAWGLLEEVVEPFVEDMKRNLSLGLDEEAFEICKGIVLGLYQCRDESGDDFLGWASDFPAEAATDAVTDWVAGIRQGSSRKLRGEDCALLLRQFVDQHVPEWQWINEKAHGKLGK